MEHIPKPPEGSVICLFCKGTIALPQGDGEKYQEHLRREHSVFYNLEWLLQQTLASQIPDLAAQKGIEIQKESVTIATQTEKKQPKEQFILSRGSSPLDLDDAGETTEEDLIKNGNQEQSIPAKRRSCDTISSPSPEKRLKTDSPELSEQNNGDDNKGQFEDIFGASRAQVENWSGDESFGLEVEKNTALDQIGNSDLIETDAKDNGLSEEDMNAFIDKISLKRFSLDVKKMKVSRINEKFTEKIFGNNYFFKCTTKCKICQKLLTYRTFHLHTKASHQMSFQAYKTKFGEKIIKREVTIYHRCKICGDELLLDKVEIKQHLVQHGTKISDYEKYMEVSKQCHKPESSRLGWSNDTAIGDKESTSKMNPIGLEAEPLWHDDDNDDAYCPDIESDGGSNYSTDIGNAKASHVFKQAEKNNTDTEDLIRDLITPVPTDKKEEHVSKEMDESDDNDIIFKPKHTSSKKEGKKSKFASKDVASSDSDSGIVSKAGQSSPAERRRSSRVKCDVVDYKEEEKNDSEISSKVNIESKEETDIQTKVKIGSKAQLRSIRELRRKGRFNRLVSESSDGESPTRSGKESEKSTKGSGMESEKSTKEETKPAEVKVAKDKPDVVEGLLTQSTSGMSKKSGQSFRNGKFYSDNFEDCCKVRCKVCMKIVKIPSLRAHTRDDHQMNVTAYKEKFGSEYDFVNEVYHKCKMCGIELLLCPDSIASHARSHHKMTAKEYTDKYITKSKSSNRCEGIMDNKSFMSKIAKEASTSIKNSKDGLSLFGTKRKKYSNKENIKDKSKDSSSRPTPRSDAPNVIIKITKKPEEATEEGDEEPSEQEDESEDENSLEENQTVSNWYDGNKYECLKCDVSIKSQFTSMRLSKFANHVKKVHSSSMTKFKGSYSHTKNMYECKFCTEEVNHEKLDIKNHVDTHFLTLEKYAQLYERDYLKKQKVREAKSDTVENPMDEEVICPPLQMDNIDLVEGGSWTSFSENNPLLEDILEQHKDILEEHNANLEHNLPRGEVEMEHSPLDRDTIGSPLSQLDQIPINQLVSADTDLLSDNSRPVSPASDEDINDPLASDEAEDGRAVNLSCGGELDPTPKIVDEPPGQSQDAVETHSQVQETPNKYPFLLKMVNESISEQSIDFTPFTKTDEIEDSPTENPSTPPPPSTGKLQKMSSEEQSLYLCPFEGCKFQTDLEGMRSGPAARHGMEVHNTQPWEIKKHGLKFKRVSVEKHLETLFADSDKSS